MKIMISKVDILVPTKYTDYRVGILSSPLEAQKIILFNKDAESNFVEIPSDESETVHPDFAADLICYISSIEGFGSPEIYILDTSVIFSYGDNTLIEVKAEKNETRIYASPSLNEQASIILKFFHDVMGTPAVLFSMVASSSIFNEETPEKEEEQPQKNEVVNDLEQEPVGETPDFEESPLMGAVSDIEKQYMESSEETEETGDGSNT